LKGPLCHVLTFWLINRTSQLSTNAECTTDSYPLSNHFLALASEPSHKWSKVKFLPYFCMIQDGKMTGREEGEVKAIIQKK